MYNASKKLERFFKVNVLCKDKDGISVQVWKIVLIFKCLNFKFIFWKNENKKKKNPKNYAARFVYRMRQLTQGEHW